VKSKILFSWSVLMAVMIIAGLIPAAEEKKLPSRDAGAAGNAAPAASPAEQSPEPKKKELYGNMPEDLEPFGKFVKAPYKKFFVPSDAAITFWGPGREKPEPEVDTVKIGLLAPVERSHEAYMGRSILNGMLLALEEANAAGGYKGKPFEAVVKNDSGLWGASANEIISFTYEEKVWAVIGTVDGANSHIAIRVALRTDIPMMNVADLDPTLMETRIPWVFRNVQDDRQMTYTIAYYVYKQLGLNKVAILRANNRYGRFGVAQFRKASIRLSKPAPIEVNYEINYDQVNMDFITQMSRLKDANPDGIILWADPVPAGILIKKIREMGMTIPVVACERILNPAFIREAGPAAEGVVATSPFNPESESPKFVEFKKKYKAHFAADPDMYAAYSYDGTNMVVDAIHQAGLNRYRIRDAMTLQQDWVGATGICHYDDVFTNRTPVTVATVKNGKWVYGIPKLEHVF